MGADRADFTNPCSDESRLYITLAHVEVVLKEIRNLFCELLQSDHLANWISPAADYIWKTIKKRYQQYIGTVNYLRDVFGEQFFKIWHELHYDGRLQMKFAMDEVLKYCSRIESGRYDEIPLSNTPAKLIEKVLGPNGLVFSLFGDYELRGLDRPDPLSWFGRNAMWPLPDLNTPPDLIRMWVADRPHLFYTAVIEHRACMTEGEMVQELIKRTVRVTPEDSSFQPLWIEYRHLKVNQKERLSRKRKKIPTTTQAKRDRSTIKESRESSEEQDSMPEDTRRSPRTPDTRSRRDRTPSPTERSRSPSESIPEVTVEAEKSKVPVKEPPERQDEASQ